MRNPPDYTADEISSTDIVMAIKKHGCCVIRNLISQQDLSSFLASSNQIYADFDQRNEHGELTEREQRHCYRYGILRPFEVDYRFGEDRSMKQFMIDCVMQSKLREVLRSYLSAQLSMLVPSTHIRRVAPSNRPVPFHQDSSVMGLTNTTILNFWFPLEKAGIDSPTVEVFPFVQYKIWEHGGSKSSKVLYSNLEIPEALVDEKLGLENGWVPIMSPGDVLILQSRTVHRTHMTPTMTKSRQDFELRFARREQMKDRTDIGQVQFDIIEGGYARL